MRHDRENQSAEQHTARPMPDNRDIASLVEAIGAQITANNAQTQAAIASLSAKVENLAGNGNAQAVEVGRLQERLATAQRTAEEARTAAMALGTRYDTLKEKLDRWSGGLALAVVVLTIALGVVEALHELHH